MTEEISFWNKIFKSFYYIKFFKNHVWIRIRKIQIDSLEPEPQTI